MVGIPDELLTKVFEPFFTTRTKGVGSGLGLSQVQGFCQEAGGSVTIESVLGRGTTVTMFLPMTHERVEPHSLDVHTPNVRGQVLLVEDNEDVAATSEMMLRSAGLDVVKMADAVEALAYLSSARRLPGVVLSDIAMPGSMDGIAFAFHLRDTYPSLPVLLTTGYAEHLNHAVAGGLKVLSKPVAAR